MVRVLSYVSLDIERNAGIVVGMNISKSIIAAVAANGWESRSWGGQLIAVRGKDELTITGTVAHHYGPSVHGGREELGMIQGVRNIVAELAR